MPPGPAGPPSYGPPPTAPGRGPGREPYAPAGPGYDDPPHSGRHTGVPGDRTSVHEFGGPAPSAAADHSGTRALPEGLGADRPSGSGRATRARRKPAEPVRGAARRRLIVVVVGALVVIGALVALSAFVWPGWVSKNLSQNSLQQGVQQVLSNPDKDKGYGLKDVKDVSCPSGKKVEEGETFTCSVSVGGQNKLVTVKILDNDGTYEVSEPAN